MKTIQLNIPKPCTQQWQEMQEETQGRFCAFCQQTVTDFTGYSDADFIAYFQQSETRQCGRLTERQLNLSIPLPQSPLWHPVKLYRYIAAGLLSITGLTAAQAQQAETTIAAATARRNDEQQQMSPDADTGFITLNGKVVDQNGIEVPGASLAIGATDQGFLSDADGNFSLRIPKLQHNDKDLVVTSVGYHYSRISFEELLRTYPAPVTIILKDDLNTFIGDITVVRKRTLWQRITQPFRKRFGS